MKFQCELCDNEFETESTGCEEYEDTRKLHETAICPLCGGKSWRMDDEQTY